MSDLFSFNGRSTTGNNTSYTAHDIEVLEGLEPVRKRPGMYIGGRDEAAMHHLVSEVLDNAMDEAVAGFAGSITIKLLTGNIVTITDNGRGIPVDNHPKFPDKSALEVIFTTLHSGGKFSDKAYQTAGGLHGVGISVVNALSDHLSVEVYRQGQLFRQTYSKGTPLTKLEQEATAKNLKGTSITFRPDPEIFGDTARFRPAKIYELAKSKAYLYRGVSIEWEMDEEFVSDNPKVPAKATIHFPAGLRDYLNSQISPDDLLAPELFCGNVKGGTANTRLEWAIGFVTDNGFIQSYCNTIPTPLGGTHEQGIRAALLRAFKAYADMVGNKKGQHITIEDILESASVVLSLFIHDPLFQGQTKEKLVSNGVSKIVENMVKDHLDHWLSGNKTTANKVLEYIISVAEGRINRRNEKNVSRKNATQRLRLPGKLADCARNSAVGTELFLVEGDSAGGSAKQARDRETQAILPLRGKILNVASSTIEKIAQNQEIQDLEIALACGSLHHFKEENLRYEKIIIMTDADVDGAHIASLLMTFFYLRMPKLITTGHLYIACPPLYRLTQGTKTHYAADDEQKTTLMNKLAKESKAKVEIGRFKGLGEMTPAQLKETTMNPKNRTLLKVNIDHLENIARIVEDLMGKKPEKRFEFIKSQALEKMDNIINNLDI